jgi:oxygen-independent coproporphyrinogen-3 oxidase
MAGIYIHIPFCKQACHYCNFHFSTSLKLQNDFLDALLKEITLRKDYTDGEHIETIYFGGGTPSLLSEAAVARIMKAIHTHFTISSDPEITLEANPDDVQPTSLIAWKNNGINRLSIGIQSFFEEDLQWMNRAHSAVQALESINLSQEAGFSNISIDLIYGTPSLSDEKWKYNMQKAADLKVPHISAYALTVEPGTALDVMTKKKKAPSVNNEDQARQFLMMTAYFQSRGYEHYEISNLSLPGKRSRHNSSYWTGAKYLGLGPSAHSYNGVGRQWNIANNGLYIQSINKNQVPSEMEELMPVQRFNEYVMTSLRTIEGLDLTFVKRIFGEGYVERLMSDSRRFIQNGWMTNGSEKLVLTGTGRLFADGIASQLFVTS